MGEEPRSCCSLFHPQSQVECLAHSRYSKKYQFMSELQEKANLQTQLGSRHQ